MILLKFKKGQGLGNQLWNYVVLRSAAEFNSLKFRLLNYENFLGKDFIDIKIENTHESYDIKNLLHYKEQAIFDNQLKCLVYSFDENILKVKDNTLIEGNLQSEMYLEPKIDIINQFISLKNLNKSDKINENTCILNIRGGEYKLHKNLILPKSYWLNGIKNMKKFKNDMNFKIISDDYNYASKLLPNYEILEGGIKEDFVNLYFSNYVILSNSSFGYFPVKLGKNPRIVIAPYQWSRFGNKENRWVSPCNFYKGWLWQNVNGELVKEAEILESINNSEKIYQTYNIRTNSEALKQFNIKDLIPLKFKKPIKNFLSKLFPLYIG